MSEKLVDLTITASSSGQTIYIKVDPTETTVLKLKESLQSQTDIPASEQRLICLGRLLKDEDLLSTYGVKNQTKITLVKRATNQAHAQASAVQSQANQPNAGLFPPPNPNSASSLGGLGGLGGLMSMDNSMFGSDFESMQRQVHDRFRRNPEEIQQMMNTPVMRSFLSNPEFMRQVINSNPELQRIMERNPEIRQLMNDPSFLRQYAELMQNPSLMREMMRTNDRTMANLEAIPGGFNALRRAHAGIYEDLEHPDVSSPTPTPSNLSSVPTQLHAPNSQPLPNPWAPPGSHVPTTQPRTVPTVPISAAPRGPTSQPTLVPNNAGVQNLMQQLLQNMQQGQTQPGAMNSPASAPPLLPQGFFANLGQPPTATQQAMQNPFLPFMNGMSQQPAPPTNQPPEERFRDQLSQMSEMGFTNRDANIRALLATGGNVNAAIEYLFNNQ